ncbi:tRNA synthetases class I (M)-domain-containing protein [Lipomyces japonicus]|uniref:tRNA synthetases class I (M)-domain-containing protein n=1 Tax=Lipomyces japonicus TaxID=56871 RepID=UPI0034CE23E7
MITAKICLACNRRNYYRAIERFSSGSVKSFCTSGRTFEQAIKSPTEKPYYITTPIFYVNAAPHIGHLYSTTFADVFKRWQQFLGRQAYLLTGTDEHGMKVQQVAEAANVKPRELCDKNSEIFKDLALAARISNDRFIRTTDSDHIAAAQKLWTVLQEKGYIYKGTHEGWYSVSDETFYTESQLEDIKSPETGETIKISKETGKTVEWSSEDNYFFALSKFTDQLLNFYEQNPRFVVPEVRYNEIKNTVRDGLPDLSISRPASRFTWAIPVPGDDSQTMYVWLDALTNYLTAAGYGSLSSEEFGRSIWPADVHVVGKDIVKFHCVYWPAFLLAAGVPPPKQIVVHSHWQMNGSKMSKSVGNVVDPFAIIKKLDVDSVRYYLLSQNILEADGDFSDQSAEVKRNADLINNYANIISRTCGPKFSISAGIDEFFSQPGKPVSRADDFLQLQNKLVNDLNELLPTIRHKMETYNVTGAVIEIFNVLHNGNLYAQLGSPWKTEPENVNPTIFHMAEIARVTSILLQPFLPSYAEKALDRLNVVKIRRGHKFARFGADREYGQGANRKGEHIITRI